MKEKYRRKCKKCKDVFYISILSNLYIQYLSYGHLKMSEHLKMSLYFRMFEHLMKILNVHRSNDPSEQRSNFFIKKS